MTDPTREAFAVDEDTINLALDAWFDGDCSRPHYDEHIDQMRAAASVIVAALSARAQQGREVGEAVAWLCSTPDGVTVNVTASEHARNDYARFGRTITPLYTHPAVRAVDVDAAFSDGVILALQVMTGAGDMGGPDYEELLNAAGAVKVYRRAEAEGMLELSGLAEYVALETHRPSAEFRAALTQPEAE